ncbi:hypothetical protein Tco_1449432 [Tanacetum coccineum]
MFAVCACARFQVTPKTSHLLEQSKNFRYLKGKLTLGLWYSRDSPFELVAYTDSDYAGATQDMKSTTGGCQFLGNRLIVLILGSVRSKLWLLLLQLKLNMWLLLVDVEKYSGFKLIAGIIVNVVRHMLMLPVQVPVAEEGLHKGYDRFQSLLSQLEIHGAGVSTEDVNQKFLRSLPSAWSQVSLITRTKPGVDISSFDDLYNNLRVFENDVKGSTASSSNTLNDRVTSCSNECKESYAKLKKLYDAQREQLSDASIEIKAYTQGLKKVEAQLVAHQQAVLTRTGKIPVNTARASGTNNVSTARHNFNRQAVPTNVAMKVNTVKPIVNRVRPATVFYKTHSPFSRPFNNTTTLRTNFTKQKVNTAEVNAVSAVGGKRETAVKPSAGCNWRQQRHH